MKKKISFRNKLIILFLLTSLLPLGLFAIYVNFQIGQSLKGKILDNDLHHVEMAKNNAEEFFSVIRSDLLSSTDFIALEEVVMTAEEGEDSGGYINEQDLGAKYKLLSGAEHMARDLTHLLITQKAYQQIRYIDENGKEIIKLYSDKGEIKTAPFKELRDQSNRSYFQESKHLPKGEIYVSSIDLKTGQDKIKSSSQPILKFATPVFNKSAGERKGIIIIDVLIKDLLNQIKSATLWTEREIEKGAQIFLTNKNGYYLINLKKPEKEFGFVFGKTDYTLQNDYPNIAYFSFDKKNSWVNGKTVEEKENIFSFAKIFLSPEDKDNFWTIVKVTPTATILSPLTDLKRIFAIIIFILAIGIAYLAYYFSGKTAVPVRVLEEKLARAKTLERIKSEFISVAAHQLRTPLSAIKWVIKMALDGDAGKLNAEQRELLNDGYENNERMIALVNDLLNVSRIEEGRFGYKFAEYNFQDILDIVVKNTKHLIKNKNLKLIINKPNIMPKAYMDKEKIALALQNLLDNAVNYTPRNGQIELNIKVRNKLLKVAVKDTGVGIPSQEQTKLFSKFFRAANVMRMQTKGTGLGLFIAKNIIDKHHGHIAIKSAENKGTEAHFTIPLKN